MTHPAAPISPNNLDSRPDLTFRPSLHLGSIVHRVGTAPNGPVADAAVEEARVRPPGEDGTTAAGTGAGTGAGTEAHRPTAATEIGFPSEGRR